MNCGEIISSVVNKKNMKINLEKERIEFYFNYFKIAQPVGF